MALLRTKTVNTLKTYISSFNNVRKLWIKKRVRFGNYSIVEPGKVSAKRIVPDYILKPSYYETGLPMNPPDLPEIKNEEQISKMRSSCKLAAKILNKIGENLQVGQTTDDIDRNVHELIINNGAYPSPLNYKMFPKSICTSVNNVACHGIPDDRPLNNGDIINIDITVFLNGYHGDCSKTFLIGDVDEEGRKLVEATETCLLEAILLCKPGEEFSSIGFFIEKRAKKLGFTVVSAFIGHGIGEYFHGPPDIFHIKNRYPGVMDAGMTFTIEPVLCQGNSQLELLEDNWTAVTIDNSRTAQAEHTVLITSNGSAILTLPEIID